nr:N-glycosylase/DNA lyase [Cryptococcus depauperatus CBS 7841]
MLRRPLFPSEWSSIPLSPSNLTLANTLPVGQSFLWHRLPLQSFVTNIDPTLPTEEYSRAIDNPPRVVCLRQSAARIYYTAIYPDTVSPNFDKDNSITNRWINDYFQLERFPDLEALYLKWRNQDPYLFGRIELHDKSTGVRVLRQDPWECLIAFITSTNNHIPRITSLLHRFSQAFSEPLLSLEHPLGLGAVIYHLFPPPHRLPSTTLESTLREIGFGYRASFIESSLQSLRNTFGTLEGGIEAGLEKWRAADIAEVRNNLMALKGVGRKVADCVMLMCLDKPSVIPIDTHVANIAARYPSFPSRLKSKNMSKQWYDETQVFLEKQWGFQMGGWCQAVMFAADLSKPTLRIKKEAKVEAIMIESNESKTTVLEARKPVLEVTELPLLKRTRSQSRQETSSTKRR